MQMTLCREARRRYARYPCRTSPGGSSRRPIARSARRPRMRCRCSCASAASCGRCAPCGAALLILLWTILACPIQAVLLLLPGRPKVVFARWYWCGVCCAVRHCASAARPACPGGRALGHLRLEPLPPGSTSPCWAAQLEACFVSKDDVARLADRERHRPARPHRLRQPQGERHRAGARHDGRAAGGRRQPGAVPRGHELGRLARAALPQRHSSPSPRARNGR